MLRHDAFRILGVPEETPTDQVRATYRELVKQMHPDARREHAGSSVELGMVVEAYRTIVRGASPGQAARRTSTEATDRSRRRERRSHATSSPPERMDAAAIASLGRFANSTADPGLRARAVQKLAASGRLMAGVYLKQAVFDVDREVAAAAAAGRVAIPGVRIESEIIALFDQLSPEQRLRVLESLEHTGRRMPRLVAYASADPFPAIRRAAEEIIFWP
jgi:hypothetical protein